MKLGLRGFQTDSRILMALLLDLADKGIPALPMHDGINVKTSDREAALEIMQSVSAKLLGAALPVKEKPIMCPAGKHLGGEHAGLWPARINRHTR